MSIIRTTLQFALLALLVCVPGLAAAQDDAVHVDKAGYDATQLDYPPLGDLNVPEPRIVTLDNGLKIFLLEDHELPQIGMIARIGAGSLWEPADQIGLASLTGAVMRTGGTTEMKPDAINTALANIGATVETGIGESSGYAYMDTLSDELGTVLPIFADVLMHPAFAKDKVKLAKTRVMSGIGRRNDNPSSVARREFSQLLYGADSPYARVSQYYTIKNIQRDDLVAFHDKYFVPNNTMLAVWGDFDSDAMVDRLRKAFGDWQADANFQRPAFPSTDGGKAPGVYFIDQPDVTQSIVLMGHMGEITRDNPDYFPVIVMNQVLSGGFAGRLFRNVRSDQGLAYSVYGGYSTGYEHKGAFRAGVGTKSATTVEAAKAVEEQIRSMQSKAPTPEELAIAKQAFLNSFVFNFDTRREILGRLMTYAWYGYPADFLQQIAQGVQKVSSQDVLRVANKYLHPDQLVTLVSGNKADMQQPLKTLDPDGKVETIDISIPTTAPGEAKSPASKADKAAGAELLGKVRQALGGEAFDGIDSLKAASTATVTKQGQESTVKSSVAIQFPDRFRVNATLPTGMVVHVIGNGDDMVLNMGSRTMPVPGPLRKRTLSNLWHSLAYLMVRADEVSAAAGGEVTIDGQTYKSLTITPPGNVTPYTLLLDPDSLLPQRLRFQSMTRMGPTESVQLLSDYREIDGIMVPFAFEARRDGETVSRGTATSVEINPDLDPALFATE